MKVRISIFFLIMVLMVVWASSTVFLFLGHCFSWQPSLTISSTIVYSLSSLTYIMSDRIADKTNSFLLKWVSGTLLGVLSISFSYSLLGILCLIIGFEKEIVGVLFSSQMIISSLLGLYFNQSPPKIKNVSIPLNKQPCRIVQLSDLHFNGLKTKKWVKEVVNHVNSLKPDYIVFTGDLLDTSLKHLNEHVDLLKQMKAKEGKFAVSGNHDFYSGYKNFQQVMKESKFFILDNKRFIDDKTQFIGLPDKQGKSLGLPRHSLTKLVDTKQSNKATILLDHSPEHGKENIKHAIDLQLSGHTHNGQIPPWNILVWLRFKFSKGIYKNGTKWIYTSIGTGTWGPPLRLFTRSEITCFDLS